MRSICEAACDSHLVFAHTARGWSKGRGLFPLSDNFWWFNLEIAHFNAHLRYSAVPARRGPGDGAVPPFLIITNIMTTRKDRSITWITSK